MTQVEITIWEKKNQNKIVKWVHDFETGVITFTMEDETKKEFKLTENERTEISKRC